MYVLFIALGLLLSAVTAEYTTTLLFVGLELDSQGLGGYVGSVIGTDATATTYSVTCPAFVGEACGIPSGFTITQGPSTMEYAFPTGGGGDMTAGCTITTDHGVCSGSILATGASGGSATVSYSTFGTDAGAVPVTITAGVAPGATGSVAVTSSTNTGVPSGETTISSSSGSGNTLSSESSIATSSSHGSKSSQVSTGGVPTITGYAQWAIGGAAAAGVIAAI